MKCIHAECHLRHVASCVRPWNKSLNLLFFHTIIFKVTVSVIITVYFYCRSLELNAIHHIKSLAWLTTDPDNTLCMQFLRQRRIRVEKKITSQTNLSTSNVATSIFHTKGTCALTDSCSSIKPFARDKGSRLHFDYFHSVCIKPLRKTRQKIC